MLPAASAREIRWLGYELRLTTNVETINQELWGIVGLS